jgi:cysteine desulfurase / selenocysteine lyase
MNISSFEEARNLFPVTNTCVYLDSAHYTPYSTETKRRLIEFIEKFTNTNFNLSVFNNEIPATLKSKISKLINANPEDIIIVSSTTHGLNIFANGISSEICKSVAYADSEFPSVVYAWMNQEKLRGIKNFMIPSDNGKIKLADVEEVIKKNKVDVLTVSSVEFLGFRNDLSELRRITNKYNALLVVDAIQSIGAVPMDVKEYDVDFLAAGSQKWMMSPAGIGFAYMPERIRKIINPSYVGTNNMNFDFTNFLNYKLNFKDDGSAFENSTPNTLGMIGLESSIDLFLQLGVENIFKHIIKLLDVFIEGLKSNPNFYVESDLNIESRSNILIFSHKDKSRNPAIQSELEKENVFFAIREGYLRASPHLFNNEDDIKKLLLALKKY